MTPASKSSLEVPLLLEKFVVRVPRAQGQSHIMDVSTLTPPVTYPTLWSTNVSGCQSGTSPVIRPAVPMSTSAATAAGTDTTSAAATTTVAVAYAANCSATMSPTIEDLYFQINADPSDI